MEIPLLAKEVGTLLVLLVMDTLSFVRFTVAPSTPPSEIPVTPFAFERG
jgi:hypothetical protein